MTDEELYKKFLGGETDVLDELLLRYKESLTLFILSLIHDEGDAEDIMMETFSLLLSRRVLFLGKSTFKTWLFGIGRNLARNYLRTKHAEPMGEELDELPSTSFDNVENSVIRSEENRELMNAMQKLPEEYRMVLFLQYFEDMSNREIALVMKKTDKQIYNLTARAKARLAELLNRE